MEHAPRKASYHRNRSFVYPREHVSEYESLWDDNQITSTHSSTPETLGGTDATENATRYLLTDVTKPIDTDDGPQCQPLAY